MSISLQTYEDLLQPFYIHHSNVRGKLVRLNQTLNTILERHQYPDSVSRLLAEAMVVAVILSGNLKGKGVLTLQMKAEGMLRLLVVDATAEGELRAYAELRDDADFEQTPNPDFAELVGEGYLAITLNKGKDPYQGIVSLRGDSLTECVQEYFTHSEQQGIWLDITVDSKIEGSQARWYAGGMMLQHMPQEGGKQQEPSQQMVEDPLELWDRAVALAQTLSESELFDLALSQQALLYRLFNEDGVWVMETEDITVGCRCSREKVRDVLSNFPQEEVESLLVDDELVVNCQFCNQAEIFSAKEVDALFAKSK